MEEEGVYRYPDSEWDTMKDLLVLVADEDMRAVMEVLLGKKYQYQLGIREVDFEVLKHPNRDPGVRTESPEVFRIRYGEFRKGLVLLDYEGSGFEGSHRELEREIKDSIVRNTPWSEQDVEVVVINPELEIWIWGVADKIGEVLNVKVPVSGKPDNPKGELERILRWAGRPPSSALFREIAGKVSRKHIEGCRDESFNRMVDTLRKWFS